MASSKRPINMPLKLAIVASGISQRALALDTRIGEIRLSAIIHLRKAATAEERRLLAKVLGRPEAELFAVPDSTRVRSSRRRRLG